MSEIKWKQIIEWNDKYFPKWRENREPIFFSNALAGEVGELCNLVKKYYGGGTNRQKVTPHDMGYEATDILIYLILFCESIGVDAERFTSLFNAKLKENTSRLETKEVAEK